jgi:hypothetical protein
LRFESGKGRALALLATCSKSNAQLSLMSQPPNKLKGGFDLIQDHINT